MRSDLNKRWSELPEEYFAQKFNTSGFPIMEPASFRVWILALFIFYLINLPECYKNEFAAVRYTSWLLVAVAAVMLVLRVIFGKKMIRKHPVGFIRCCMYSLNELKLFFLASFLLVTSGALADQIMEFSDEIIVNCTYIFGGVLLLLDIIISLVLWRKMKERVVAGAFKEDGNGFFGDMKNKDMKWLMIVKISGIVLPLLYATRLLARVFEDAYFEIYDYVYIPLLVIFLLAVIALFLLVDFGNAYLKGRMHYVSKFGVGNALDVLDAMEQRKKEKKDKKKKDTQ